MSTDFEPFKKLPPETRVGELQRLIVNLKKHIENHQRDIRTAETLLAVASDEQKVLEQEVGKVAEIQTKYKTSIPKDIQEQTKILAAKLPAQPLEGIVGVEPSREPRPAERPLSEFYQSVRTIYEAQRQTGIETYEQRQQIYEIHKGLEEKRRDIEQGKYRPGERQKHLLTTTEQLLGNIYHDNKNDQNNPNKVYRTNN